MQAHSLTRVDHSSVGSSSVFDVVLVHARQMRADREGVAIIMCESTLENKYRALGQSQTTLESFLHTNLAEHLNSEIGLGTIRNMETAKEWIRHSFMFRRLAQNPHRYMPNEQPWKDGLDDMISKCLDDLRDAQLLTYVDERSKELRSTEFGEIMSKVRSLKIDRPTSAHRSSTVLHQAGYGIQIPYSSARYTESDLKMASIMSLPVKATLREMVGLLQKPYLLGYAAQSTFFIKLEALSAAEECVGY